MTNACVLCLSCAAQERKASVRPKYRVQVRDALDAERSLWKQCKTLTGELCHVSVVYYDW